MMGNTVNDFIRNFLQEYGNEDLLAEWNASENQKEFTKITKKIVRKVGGVRKKDPKDPKVTKADFNIRSMEVLLFHPLVDFHINIAMITIQ